MHDPASFSVVERLRNGRQIEIRALEPGDRQALLAAADRTSDRSLYRRFFGVVDVVALIALAHESGREVIAGGGRYIVVRPGTAELAFTVVDEFQGQGIASALLRHLITLARAAGLRQFIAEVLPENLAMLQVFERSGLELKRQRESDVVHLTLQLL